MGRGFWSCKEGVVAGGQPVGREQREDEAFECIVVFWHMCYCRNVLEADYD